MRFHIDACPPKSPWYKGKVERDVRDASNQRRRHRHWESLTELQSWEDAQTEKWAHRRICPATGTSVWEAYQEEKRTLGDAADPEIVAIDSILIPDKHRIAMGEDGHVLEALLRKHLGHARADSRALAKNPCRRLNLEIKEAE